MARKSRQVETRMLSEYLLKNYPSFTFIMDVPLGRVDEGLARSVGAARHKTGRDADLPRAAPVRPRGHRLRGRVVLEVHDDEALGHPVLEGEEAPAAVHAPKNAHVRPDENKLGVDRPEGVRRNIGQAVARGGPIARVIPPPEVRGAESAQNAERLRGVRGVRLDVVDVPVRQAA